MLTVLFLSPRDWPPPTFLLSLLRQLQKPGSSVLGPTGKDQTWIPTVPRRLFQSPARPAACTQTVVLPPGAWTPNSRCRAAPGEVSCLPPRGLSPRGPSPCGPSSARAGRHVQCRFLLLQGRQFWGIGSHVLASFNPISSLKAHPLMHHTGGQVSTQELGGRVFVRGPARCLQFLCPFTVPVVCSHT